MLLWPSSESASYSGRLRTHVRDSPAKFHSLLVFREANATSPVLSLAYATEDLALPSELQDPLSGRLLEARFAHLTSVRWTSG